MSINKPLPPPDSVASKFLSHCSNFTPLIHKPPIPIALQKLHCSKNEPVQINKNVVFCRLGNLYHGLSIEISSISLLGGSGGPAGDRSIAKLAA